MGAKERRGIFMGVEKRIIDLSNTELLVNPFIASFSDAGITPAIVTDPIYQINDLTANNNHLVQIVASSRPTLQTGNGTVVCRSDGITDIMTAGDVLDSVTSGADKHWAFCCNLDNYSVAGGVEVSLIGKHATVSGDRSWLIRIRDNGRVILFWQTDPGIFRGVRGDTQLDGGPHNIWVEYDGAIDTNDGRDRVTIEIDGVGMSNTLLFTAGVLPDIPDKSAGLTTCALYDTAPATNIQFPTAHDTGPMGIVSNPTASDKSIWISEFMGEWSL